MLGTRLRNLTIATISIALVAGCSSSGGGGKSSSSGQPTGGGPSSSTKSSTAGLPSKPATGSPVVIGFINSDSSPLGNFADITDTAKAAAQYANDSLGGLGGHKVQVRTCADDGADNTAASCATKLLAAHPVAIVTGLDPGSSGSVPIVTKAGVPYIGTTPITAQELGTPGAYAFSAGIGGSFGAADLYFAKTLKVKNVGIITNDTPTAAAVANGLGIALLKSLGSNGKLVTHSLTQTDLTAAWTSASRGADAAMAIEPSTQCVAAMRARATAGSSIPLVEFGCSDTKTIQAAGAAANGVYFGSGYESPDATTTDAALYRKIMDKYAPKAQRDSYTESIVSSFVILSRILAAQTTVTAATTKAAIAKAADVPGFLTPSLTCNGKQVPNLPAFCSGAGYVLQVKNGKLTDVGGGPKRVFPA